MEPRSLETICVVGAGVMGAQIGLHCAAHGYRVHIIGRSEASLQRAAQSHAQELKQRLEQQHITADEERAILHRITMTTKMQEGLAQADLVIENVPERLDIKREIFAQLDQLCPAHTILATNSSSLRISAIEDATQRPDRVLNLHFYQPVWQRPMVELMRGSLTSDETVERVRQFARRIG